MSVLRVITRIIPLNDDNSSFDPAPFNALTNVSSNKVKVFEVIEPQSGLKYRIERIEEVHDVGPGETIENVNKEYADKLKKVPGFVQLKESNTQLSSYEKCLKVSVPKVISLTDDFEGTDAITISVVKNDKFRKQAKKGKNCGLLNKRKFSEVCSGVESSSAVFKSKYPPYVQKKLNKITKLKNKKSRACNSPNLVKSSKTECSMAQMSDFPSCSSHEEANFDSRTSISLDDSSYDLECGDLIINVPETVDANSDCEQVDTSIVCGAPSCQDKSSSLIAGNSIAESVNNLSIIDQFDSSQAASSNVIEYSSKDNLVPVEHPLYDFLQPLMKYFMSGECLICGFVPAETDFDAVIHMESHISTGSSYYYKCICCNEKFCNPRSLYEHALSREKIYNYMCALCFLKFKRRHYLLRHNAKSHRLENK